MDLNDGGKDQADTSENKKFVESTSSRRENDSDTIEIQNNDTKSGDTTTDCHENGNNQEHYTLKEIELPIEIPQRENSTYQGLSQEDDANGTEVSKTNSCSHKAELDNIYTFNGREGENFDNLNAGQSVLIEKKHDNKSDDYNANTNDDRIDRDTSATFEVKDITTNCDKTEEEIPKSAKVNDEIQTRKYENDDLKCEMWDYDHLEEENIVPKANEESKETEVKTLKEQNENLNLQPKGSEENTDAMDLNGGGNDQAETSENMKPGECPLSRTENDSDTNELQRNEVVTESDDTTTDGHENSDNQLHYTSQETEIQNETQQIEKSTGQGLSQEGDANGTEVSKTNSCLLEAGLDNIYTSNERDGKHLDSFKTGLEVINEKERNNLSADKNDDTNDEQNDRDTSATLEVTLITTNCDKTAEEIHKSAKVNDEFQTLKNENDVLTCEMWDYDHLEEENIVPKANEESKETEVKRLREQNENLNLQPKGSEEKTDAMDLNGGGNDQAETSENMKPGECPLSRIENDSDTNELQRNEVDTKSDDTTTDGHENSDNQLHYTSQETDVQNETQQIEKSTGQGLSQEGDANGTEVSKTNSCLLEAGLDNIYTSNERDGKNIDSFKTGLEVINEKERNNISADKNDDTNDEQNDRDTSATLEVTLITTNCDKTAEEIHKSAKVNDEFQTLKNENDVLTCEMWDYDHLEEENIVPKANEESKETEVKRLREQNENLNLQPKGSEEKTDAMDLNGGGNDQAETSENMKPGECPLSRIENDSDTNELQRNEVDTKSDDTTTDGHENSDNQLHYTSQETDVQNETQQIEKSTGQGLSQEGDANGTEVSKTNSCLLEAGLDNIYTSNERDGKNIDSFKTGLEVINEKERNNISADKNDDTNDEQNDRDTSATLEVTLITTNCDKTEEEIHKSAKVNDEFQTLKNENDVLTCEMWDYDHLEEENIVPKANEESKETEVKRLREQNENLNLQPKGSEEKTDAMDLNGGGNDQAETSENMKPGECPLSRIENDSDTNELQRNEVDTKSDDTNTDGHENSDNQLHYTSQETDVQNETQQIEKSTGQGLSQEGDANGTEVSKTNSCLLEAGLDNIYTSNERDGKNIDSFKTGLEVFNEKERNNISADKNDDTNDEQNDRDTSATLEVTLITTNCDKTAEEMHKSAKVNDEFQTLKNENDDLTCEMWDNEHIKGENMFLKTNAEEKDTEIKRLKEQQENSNLQPKVVKDKTDAMDSNGRGNDQAETSENRKPGEYTLSKIENDSDTNELQRNEGDTKSDDTTTDGHENRDNKVHDTSQEIEFPILIQGLDVIEKNHSNISDDNNDNTKDERNYRDKSKMLDYDHLKEENIVLKTNAEAKETEIKTLKEQNENLNLQLKVAEEAKETEIKKLKEQNENLNLHLKVSEEKKETEIKTLKEQDENLNLQVRDLQKNLELLRNKQPETDKLREDYEALRNVFRSLENENKELQAKADEQRKTYNTAIEQNQILREKINEQLNDIQQLQNEIKYLEEKQLSSSEKMQALLDEKLQELDMSIKEMQKKDQVLIDLQKQITLDEQKIQSSEKQYAEIKDALKEANIEKDTLQKNMEKFENDNINLVNKMNKLKGQYEEQETCKNLLERKVNELTKTLKSGHEESERIKESNKQMQQSLAKLQSIVSSYHPTYEKVMEMEANLVSAWPSFINEQKSNREERAELERRRLELNEMEKEVNANESKIKEERNEMLENKVKLKASIENLITRLADSEEKVASIQEELNKSVDDVTRYKTDLSMTKQANNDLQSKLMNVESMLEEKHKKLSQIENVCDQIKRNETVLKQENAKLIEEKLQQLSLMLKDREMMDQMREVDRTNAQRIREQCELIQHQAGEIRDGKELITKLDKEKQEQKDDWTSKYLQKTAEMELERGNHKKTLDEKTMFQNCMSVQAKEIKKLQELQKTLDKNIQDLKKENKQKEDENKRLTDRVQAFNKSIKELNERINVEKEQHAYVKGLLSTKISEKEKADMSSIVFSSEIRVLQAHITSMEQRIQQLCVEKEDVKARLDATEIRLGTVVSLEEKVQQYREQNQRLKDELEKATIGYQRVTAMTGDRNSENETLKQENTRLKREIRSRKEREAVLLAAKRTLEEQNQSLRMDLNDSLSF